MKRVLNKTVLTRCPKFPGEYIWVIRSLRKFFDESFVWYVWENETNFCETHRYCKHLNFWLIAKYLKYFIFLSKFKKFISIHINQYQSISINQLKINKIPVFNTYDIHINIGVQKSFKFQKFWIKLKKLKRFVLNKEV